MVRARARARARVRVRVRASAPVRRVARERPMASSARSEGQLCPWDLHPDRPARATELLHPLVQAGAAAARILCGSGERRANWRPLLSFACRSSARR